MLFIGLKNDCVRGFTEQATMHRQTLKHTHHSGLLLPLFIPKVLQT